MLLLNLIPLIDVTFSTPTGYYNNCSKPAPKRVLTRDSGMMNLQRWRA